MKDAWKTIKETCKTYLPAALAALIGYAIARTKVRTAQLEAQPSHIKKPAPQLQAKPDNRRAKRRRRR